MQSKLQRIEKFVNSDLHNTWLQLGSLQLYLRKTQHWLGDNLCTTLDIPNVYFRKEADMGKGVFTGILRGMEVMLKEHKEYDAIFIENVLTPRLSAFLLREGWAIAPDYSGFGGEVNSFYKLLK